MKIRVLLAASLMVLLSGAAWALGLGEIVVNSRLNQPLSAEIVVREAFRERPNSWSPGSPRRRTSPGSAWSAPGCRSRRASRPVATNAARP